MTQEQNEIELMKQVKKAIRILGTEGKSEKVIADVISTCSQLLVDKIPASFEKFAEVMVKYDLSAVEVDSLYRARVDINCRKKSYVFEQENPNIVISLSKLAEIYKTIDDSDIFESFVEYCRENLQANLVKVYRDWATENAELFATRHRFFSK